MTKKTARVTEIDVTETTSETEHAYAPLDVIEDEMVVIPAGTYVVGDPCYVVPDECWDDYLDAANYRTMHVLAATIDGHPVVGVGTAFGDGGYEDAQGRTYSVDAGLIGLVPVALVSAKDMETVANGHSHVIEFPNPVVCHWSTDEGTITLGHIKIKTDPAPEPIFCFACGRPSDSEDYCTWGCGHGEEEPDEDDDIDEDEE